MKLDGLVYWGLTPQEQPGSYQGGEMMVKSVFWWRKPEQPEETTDLRQVTDETFHTYGRMKLDPGCVLLYFTCLAKLTVSTLRSEQQEFPYVELTFRTLKWYLSQVNDAVF